MNFSGISFLTFNFILTVFNFSFKIYSIPFTQIFLTDFCSFITQLQAALGAKEGGISLPFAPALGLAQALDGLWGMVNRGQSLNLQAGVRMFGQSIAPSDAQFRQASGYRPVVSVAQGLKRLKAANER